MASDLKKSAAPPPDPEKVAQESAIQSNTCHTLLVQDCELRHPTEFDHAEDIHVRLVPVEHIPDLIASGRIRHALVVVALSHFLMLPRDVPASA